MPMTKDGGWLLDDASEAVDYAKPAPRPLTYEDVWSVAALVHANNVKRSEHKSSRVKITLDWLGPLPPMVRYSEDQPRDDDGRWTSEGGGASSSVKEGGAKPYGKGLDKEGLARANSIPIAGETDTVPVFRTKTKVDTEMVAGKVTVGKDGQPKWTWAKSDNKAIQKVIDRAKADFKQEGVGDFGVAVSRMEDLYRDALASDAENLKDPDWYKSKSEIMTKVAEKYGVGGREVGAAVAAQLSPQLEWGKNEEIATAVMRAVGEDKPVKVTVPMVTTAVNTIKHDQIMGARYKEEQLSYLESLASKGSVRPSEIRPDVAGVFMGLNPGSFGIPNMAYPDNIAKACDYAVWGKNGTFDPVKSPELRMSDKANKIRSFYNNLSKPESSDAVTVDIHMIRALTGNLELGSGKDSSGEVSKRLKGQQLDRLLGNRYKYQFWHAAVTTAAARAGAERSHKVQSKVWLHWKNLHDDPKEVGGNLTAKKAREAKARYKATGTKGGKGK